MNGVKIAGVGMSVPKKCVTNNDLSTFLETDDEWISTRTGIKSRYIATDETTTQLATEAARRAMEYGDIPPETIDLIIVATISLKIGLLIV